MSVFAAEQRRTLAPPQARRARVMDVRAVGAYLLTAAADAGGPPDPRPGQFYMLSTAQGWGGHDGRPYLPRAFSFARVRAGGGEGGATLEFLLEEVGPGTRRLAGASPGEELVLLGPLGTGFGPPAAGSRPLLVGGGIGVAPILALSDELRGDAPVVLGFRSAGHAAAAELFEVAVTVTTDDGSAGRHGLVTEPLAELLDDGAPATVYACGPPPMLEAVRALCAERSVPAQLALEAGMACGYGACFGCVVRTRAGYLRLCVDGPVLDAHLLEPGLDAGAAH